MDLSDSPELADYRAVVRRRMEELAPQAPCRDAVGGYDVGAHRAWQRHLADAKLVGVTWPMEYGGSGLGPIHRLVVGQELSRAGLPGVFDLIGAEILGPTLIEQGTEAQRERHLAPMLRADEVWCQLFSEPAAGSDLGGIRTRAVRKPDGSWRVTGQKVWTSNAQHAAFGMLLARTDDAVPKHKGLTMLIVPMDASGITVRGLRQISGAEDFSEVFLDDVHVGSERVCGEVGDGWGVAMTVLMYERLAVGATEHFLGLGPERYVDVVLANPHAADDPVICRRLGRIGAELIALRFAGYRQISELARGRTPGPEGSLGKLTGVSAASAACDLVLDVLGPDALESGSEWYERCCHLPAARSAGGTEEVLRTMVGERMLGLPPEPRVDKTLPFAELARQGRS